MLKIHENTATNILLTAIVFFLVLFFFYPFFTRSRVGLENFVASTFFNKQGVINNTVGNVYTVKVNSNYIEPEKIYIYKDDVLKIVNNSGIRFDLKEILGNNLVYSLDPNTEYFKKFEKPGEYKFSVGINSKEFLTVYVK